LTMAAADVVNWAIGDTILLTKTTAPAIPPPPPNPPRPPGGP
jgi:hypothetical protein